MITQEKITVERPRFNDQKEHVCVKCAADVEAYPDSQASALLVCQSKTCGYRYLVLF
jgi:DNA-directed RNA polymerase subunit RPC12/RpoP